VRFSRDVLSFDPEARAEALAAALREAVLRRLRRRGVVVAVSGGIDSACVAALAVRALGPTRVLALLLPERESSPASTALGRQLCEALGIAYDVRDITPVLEAAGCYRMREEALRAVVPGFAPSMPWKLAMHGDRLGSDALNIAQAVVRTPAGERRFRLPPDAYARIVAATNLKQRTRKMIEYTEADRHGFAVAGTPNRLEYDQGFFVKLGDGAADVKPIAALYKTQVYALARHLGVVPEILARPPTTDTFSLAQGQDEFYFSVDYPTLDLLLWARDHGIATAEAAGVLGLRPEQVRRVYDDIDQKRRATAYLHAPPLLLEPLEDPADEGEARDRRAPRAARVQSGAGAEAGT
jgi:NAD+ synthase